MGACLWQYYAPFDTDVATTLEALRQREFAAGRYYRSELKPQSIPQAIANTDDQGTYSILDVDRVASLPAFGAVSPVPHERLLAIFGSDRPTRQMVEEVSERSWENTAMSEVIEEIERGEGRSIVIYDGDKPVEVYFCGYTWD
jgi:hypothetical protein